MLSFEYVDAFLKSQKQTLFRAIVKSYGFSCRDNAGCENRNNLRESVVSVHFFRIVRSLLMSVECFYSSYFVECIIWSVLSSLWIKMQISVNGQSKRAHFKKDKELLFTDFFRISFFVYEVLPENDAIDSYGDIF